jgi:endonuclease/exonuclease/phosphatase family metal-dependent hydrolase
VTIIIRRMRFVIFLIFILLIFFSCNKEEIDYANNRTSYFKNIKDVPFNDTSITCVTFNIHLGFRADQDPWNNNETGADEEQVKNIAQSIKKVNPDIVALQEVPRNRYNAKIKYFLEALAQEMGMNYSYGSHGYNDPYGIYPVYGEWGTAILTKYKIININNIEVEYISKWEKRSMLDAFVEINPTTKIHVISLHYLPTEQGIPNTAKYIETISEPIILMGDFNYTGEIQNFKNIGLLDVDSAYKNHWIDRVFYSGKHFKCKEFGTIPDSSWWISDHQANYGIIKFIY